MSDVPWITTSEGVKMPAMVYGTAWKKDRTAGLVLQALKAGFRGVDTACQPRHYHEPGVGEALKTAAREGIAARDDLFLQTKFTPADGQDPESTPYDRGAPVADQVAQSFAASRKNLGTDRVDSLVLHSPLDTLEETMEAWGAMEEVYGAGGAGQLGVSNCYELDVMQALYERATVKPAVLQNRFYGQTGYDVELRAWCASHGITYQSFWTLTANKHVLASEETAVLAEKHGRTPAQVFFRYVAHLGIVPLTGTTSEEHMEADLAVFDFELSEDDRAVVARQLGLA